MFRTQAPHQKGYDLAGALGLCGAGQTFPPALIGGLIIDGNIASRQPLLKLIGLTGKRQDCRKAHVQRPGPETTGAARPKQMIA